MAEDPQTRERLPNRLQSVVLDLDCRGSRDEGRIGEAFVTGAKVASDNAGPFADLGVLISRASQHGDSIA